MATIFASNSSNLAFQFFFSTTVVLVSFSFSLPPLALAPLLLCRLQFRMKLPTIDFVVPFGTAIKTKSSIMRGGNLILLAFCSQMSWFAILKA
jgi:hypothetical protein